jgi:uroporphyrinogen decarboxylase
LPNKDYRFLKACRGEPVDTTPIWIMRQAGRYLPEYQAIRGKVSFLELCKTPDLAAEVTIQPIDILGVDAAILFSDILIPLEAMGMSLRFDEGHGPILENPVTDRAGADRLGVPDPEETMGFVMEAIKILRRELEGRVPLIGFAGAPFTMASYMVEGGSSKNFLKLKTLMFQKPEVWHQLMEKTARTTQAYLQAQIDAGAQAVQLFDSWGGILSPRDYRDYALPYSQRIIESLKGQNVPIIHFVQGNPALLPQVASAGSDVVGVDWRIDIGEARKLVGDKAVQGNLDPLALFLPIEKIEERAGEIIAAAGPAGHIFNLGHGILPPTPVENAKALVEAVHRISRTYVGEQSSPN